MQSDYHIWFTWAEQLVKGLKKAYWIDLSENLQLIEYSKSNLAPIIITNEEIKGQSIQYFKRFRSKEWLLEEEIPFHLTELKTEIRQLSLNQETERNLLALRLENSHQNIILVLFLKGASSVLGPTLSESVLKLQHKKIIEELLYRSLEAHIKLNDSNAELQKQLASYQVHLRESNIKYRELAKFSALNQAQNIEAYIKNLLTDLGNECNLILDINKDCIQYLINENISPEVLKSNLTRMIDVLKFSAEDGRLMIDQVDLEWALTENSKESISSKPLLSAENIGRLTKTKQLLDRYEEAARQAVYNDENVNGKNIAKYCNPSVSNASITDALKKHRERVVELMLKSNNDWPLLRSKFRSIHNILDAHYENRNIA